MTISEHIKKPMQIKYVRAYLAPRNLENEYDDYINVTRFVVDNRLGDYERSIDSNDFDIGFFEESSLSIGFDNSEAKFTEGYGYFDNKIVDRSKLKIVAGFHDTDDLVPEYEVTFEGIIDDRGTSLDAQTETAVFTVLSYSSIVGRLRTDPGAVTNGQSFSTALFNLLNRSEITSLLTVDADNIEPKVDLTIDDASWFTGKQLKSSLEGILLASNSVMKITDNTIYITSRQESDTVRFQFWGKGSPRPSNIESIKNFNNGQKRVITRVQINSTTTVDAIDEILERYGSQIKTLDIGFIDDEATIESIANDILEEFQYPKRELELTTDFLSNEVELLDMVTIDNQGTIVEASPSKYGQAVYGTAKYTRRRGGVKIRQNVGFKILGISHDYQQYSTTLKLREIGFRPFDSSAGYRNPLYGQAVYSLSRYANVS